MVGPIAMLRVEAAVDGALDARASGQPIDLPAIVAGLRRPIGAVKETSDSRAGAWRAVDAAAHLVPANASLTRLTGPTRCLGGGGTAMERPRRPVADGGGPARRGRRRGSVGTVALPQRRSTRLTGWPRR